MFEIANGHRRSLTGPFNTPTRSIFAPVQAHAFPCKF
jgi:hypothetical protein